MSAKREKHTHIDISLSQRECQRLFFCCKSINVLNVVNCIAPCIASFMSIECIALNCGLYVRTSFMTKYFIESSFRYDGSSRFAPGKRWGFFPSASIGWRISEESFFSNLKDIVPDLKLRGSIGTAGNDGTAAYQWLSGFTYNHFFAINETAIPTIDNTALANLDLTWETIKTYDIGLDARLLNNALSISLDYFYRSKDGVLAYASGSVPSTLGVGLAAKNFHEYSNEGFEMGLNYKQDYGQHWNFETGLILSYSRETAEFIDEAEILDEFMKENLTIKRIHVNHIAVYFNLIR